MGGEGAQAAPAVSGRACTRGLVGDTDSAGCRSGRGGGSHRHSANWMSCGSCGSGCTSLRLKWACGLVVRLDKRHRGAVTAPLPTAWTNHFP